MLQKLNFNFAGNRFVLEGSATIKQEDGYTMVMTVPGHEFWKNIYGEEEKKPSCVFFFKEIEPGIYITGLNFNHKIKQYTDFDAVNPYERLGKDGIPKKLELDNFTSNYFEDTVECYGIADNIDQIKERYKEQIASDASIVISITEINKDNQPEEGGWRWHKWGEYIGSKSPQHEYLYDEPEIDSVYVFHVYSVKLKAELVLNDAPAKKVKM